MVKKLFTLFLFTAFVLNAVAQDRYLLRIGKEGKQEAIPLKKGEVAKDVIERLENAKASYAKASSGAGLIDTIRYFTSDAQLTTNFGWTHQDVAFQWYVPSAGGVVKEFWWRNYNLRGTLNKGTIRGWLADAKLLTLPANAFDGTGRMGYYAKTDDGDGLVTPFKSEATSTWWYKGNGGDTTKIGFDPLGTEAAWLPGGYQFSLDSNKWQGIKLADWGDSMKFNANVPFGFTLMNDSKVSDGDDRMEILSKTADGAPYHSIKFYEIRTAAANAPGWQIRSYEWGMYAVVEYTTDRPPIVTVGSYGTTLTPGSRTITAIVTDDNPGGGTAGVASARVISKIGSLGAYDSTAMTNSGSSYSGTTKSAVSGDTVYWYISATDVNGNRTVTPVRSYVIFKKNKKWLFIYNNAQYSLGTANLITNGGSSSFDRWSAPNDGVGELNTLLALYNTVVLSDGSFPARDVYSAIGTWLNNATASNPATFFFNSQDYGCYVNGTCADTTFPATAWENKFLGIDKLGPQDLPPTAQEFKVVPQADTVTNYLIKYNSDSGTTLWYNPTFELGFAGYQDEFTKTANAKTLFTHGAGTGIVGIKNITTTTRTMFLAFDAGALQFRTDTSLASGSDPKYQWIVDIGSLSISFLNAHTSVKPVDGIVPGEFALGQNYPNPFNPTTTIEYKVPARANVEIAIYNVIGQKVATVVNDVHEAGTHRATWNGRDASGKLAATGVYFYSLKAGSFEQVKKMMLVK